VRLDDVTLVEKLVAKVQDEEEDHWDVRSDEGRGIPITMDEYRPTIEKYDQGAHDQPVPSKVGFEWGVEGEEALVKV